MQPFTNKVVVQRGSNRVEIQEVDTDHPDGPSFAFYAGPEVKGGVHPELFFYMDRNAAMAIAYGILALTRE